MKPVDNGTLASYKPGQFLTLKVDLPQYGECWRHFTLSDMPGLDYYRITVKKKEGHNHVSDYLFTLKENDKIECRTP